MKSVRKASRELALPRSTVWDVLHKHLKFKAYKLTLVQALTKNDKQLGTVFSLNLLEFLENDLGDKIVFSDEATFHTDGRGNRHNVRIWGSKHPRQIIQHVKRFSKVERLCCHMQKEALWAIFLCRKN